MCYEVQNCSTWCPPRPFCLSFGSLHPAGCPGRHPLSHTVAEHLQDLKGAQDGSGLGSRHPSSCLEGATPLLDISDISGFLDVAFSPSTCTRSSLCWIPHEVAASAHSPPGRSSCLQLPHPSPFVQLLGLDLQRFSDLGSETQGPGRGSQEPPSILCAPGPIPACLGEPCSWVPGPCPLPSPGPRLPV